MHVKARVFMLKILRRLKNLLYPERYNRPYPYDIDFYIMRVERRLLSIRRMFFPLCPFCDTTMQVRYSNIVVIKGCPVRDDVHVKCVKCFYTAHFGLPITKREALEEIRLRGGNTRVLRPTYNIEERSREDIKKKLIELGYIEISS